jgi:hypothetical protein
VKILKTEIRASLPGLGVRRRALVALVAVVCTLTAMGPALGPATGQAMAFDVAFPGPDPIGNLGTASCALSVLWPDTDNEYLIVGGENGFLSVVRLISGESNFNVLDRQYLAGKLTGMVRWENPGAGIRGLVVVSSDPDRVVFVEIRDATPYLVVTQTVVLPEDPGSLAFVGPSEPGGTALAVSLPGIDQVAVLTPVEGEWEISQVLDAGDRPTSLVGLDLDNDGVREIISADQGILSGALGHFKQDQDGLFFREGQWTIPGRPLVLDTVDLDGDGRPELAVSLADSAEVILLEAVDGALVEESRLSLTLPGQSLHLTPLADGRTALFSAAGTRGLVEFQIRDNGQWQAVKNYYPGCRPRQLTTGDFNGDGRPDLVSLGDDQLPTSVMFALSDGTYQGFPALAMNRVPGSSTLADFNGDGIDDLVVAGSDQPVLSFFAGQPDGGLARSSLDQNLGFLSGAVVAIDAGASPGPELALLDLFTGQLRILDYDPDEGFSPWQSRILLPFPQELQTTDLDGDGHADLFMARNSAQDLLVTFGDGEGNFTGDVELAMPTGARKVLALDLNADQRPDLVAADGSSRVYVRLNLDGRTFGPASWVLAGSGARQLAAGDLDGDLDLDVVVGNETDESLTFLENNGQGGLTRRIGNHVLGARPLGLFCADMNKSGDTDVVVNLGEEGQVGLVLGLGNWTYGSAIRFSGGTTISSFRQGDFNLDGFPDVLNFDSNLRLGLTLLNVDPSSVAVDPQALGATCTAEGLTVVVHPDRPGPWDLSLWWNEAWRSLVSSGVAEQGRLDFAGGQWVLRVSWSEIRAAWGETRTAAARLKLTLGAPESAESLEWNLGTDCLDSVSEGIPSPLRWDAEPWPNPFNPRVQSRIFLDQPGRVTAGVFDLAGRRVAILLDEEKTAGSHLLAWDGKSRGRPVAGGVYFLNIRAGGTALSKKIILLK